MIVCLLMDGLIINALEWGILRDPLIGALINERGTRAFNYPGARSINEPDVDFYYEEDGDFLFVVHDLIFRGAKAHYDGKA